MHFDLFEGVGDLVLDLSVLDNESLQLFRQLCLPVFDRISRSYRCFLHRLELQADVLDELLFFDLE